MPIRITKTQISGLQTPTEDNQAVPFGMFKDLSNNVGGTGPTGHGFAQDTSGNFIIKSHLFPETTAMFREASGDISFNNVDGVDLGADSIVNLTRPNSEAIDKWWRAIFVKDIYKSASTEYTIVGTKTIIQKNSSYLSYSLLYFQIIIRF